MDPTLSWIDAREVQAALAHVRRASPARAEPKPTPESKASGQAAAAQSALAGVEALGYPGTIAGRVAALARWVELNVGPQRWFLADDQGLPIHDAGFGEARIGELCHAMRDWRPGPRPNPIEGVTFHLTGERRLLALWVRTPVGATVIALENPAFETLSVVRKAVEYAFRGNTHA